MMDPADLSAEEQDRLYDELVKSYQDEANREWEARMASMPKPARRRRTLKGTWYKVRNWARHAMWHYQVYRVPPFPIYARWRRLRTSVMRLRQRLFGLTDVEKTLARANAKTRMPVPSFMELPHKPSAYINIED